MLPEYEYVSIVSICYQSIRKFGLRIVCDMFSTLADMNLHCENRNWYVKIDVFVWILDTDLNIVSSVFLSIESDRVE